jgi:hypothetical protein
MAPGWIMGFVVGGGFDLVLGWIRFHFRTL